MRVAIIFFQAGAVHHVGSVMLDAPADATDDRWQEAAISNAVGAAWPDGDDITATAYSSPSTSDGFASKPVAP